MTATRSDPARLCRERVRTHKGKAERVQRLEQRVERRNGIVVTVLSLETGSVESDVPIRQLVNEGKQTRHDSVQSVSCDTSQQRKTRTGDADVPSISVLTCLIND